MAKVLVAIDGSSHAIEAFRDAVELFGDDAEYLLISVVPPWSTTSALAAMQSMTSSAPSGTSAHGTASTGMPLSPDPSSVSAGIDQVYDNYRDAQAQAAASVGVDAEHLIEEAKPKKRRIGRAICDAAADRDVDVLVVGSHGSSYAGERLLGSVTQYLVHNAPCPVFVSRRDEE